MIRTAPKNRQKKAHLYGKGVSIYFKEDQNRWMCSVKLESGKRKYIAGSVGAPFEKCEEKFRAAIEEIRKGTRVDFSRQTVREYLALWLEEKRIAMKQGVYPVWKNYLDVHVMEDLGPWKLQKLKREQVQAWVGRMIKKKLAASTIRFIHEVLSLALKDAVKRNILVINPCAHVSLPRVEEKEMQFLDLVQSRRLLAIVEQCDPLRRALFRVAITTGIRLGELTGLRWGDVDLEEKIIKIRRTVVYLPREGYHENEPKSKAGLRTIPLTPEAVLALRELKAQSQGNLVFRGSTREGYLSDTTLRKWLRLLLKEAGLPHIRFHDLRHTAATLYLRAGASLRSLQRLLGHARIETTMRYVHLLPEQLYEDVERLGVLLRSA